MTFLDGQRRDMGLKIPFLDLQRDEFLVWVGLKEVLTLVHMGLLVFFLVIQTS